jgi:hypothetical protein
MSRKMVVVLLLITSIILAGVPESFARPQYFTALTAVYGSGYSCGTCHIDPNGSGPRNAYGLSFQSQSNHRAVPGAALVTIGAPPNANPTVIATATLTPAATATMTPTPAVTTVTATATPVSPAATATPATPGFEIVLSLAGLLSWHVLAKRYNK